MTRLIREIRDAYNDQLEFQEILTERINAFELHNSQITNESVGSVLDRIDHRLSISALTDSDKLVIAKSLAALAMIKKNQNHSQKGPQLRDLIKNCSANVVNDLENIIPGVNSTLTSVVSNLMADLNGSRLLTRNLVKDLRDFKLDADK